MISALVQVYDRFRAEGGILPLGYKDKDINWIVDISGNEQVSLLGPFHGQDVRRFPAPDRQRSGVPSPTNLKPYLLVDNGQYALGITEPGGSIEATTLVHEGFVEIVRKAAKAVSDPALDRVVRFLENPIPDELSKQVGARDQILFRSSGRILTDEVEVQDFWSQHLGDVYVDEVSVACSVCGHRSPPVKTLPGEVVILGQKCQISSFNTSFSATESFGRKQLLNAPVCYRCASRAIQTLQHLTTSRQHRINLLPNLGQDRPLQRQLAVYWLKSPSVVEIDNFEIDVEAALSAAIDGKLRSGVEHTAPEPELTQLRNLLRLPWRASQDALALDQNAFYLAVLSANKARLVVREWIDVSITQLRTHLATYLDALSIVDGYGHLRPVSVRSILDALGSTDPQLSRGCFARLILGNRLRRRCSRLQCSDTEFPVTGPARVRRMSWQQR